MNTFQSIFYQAADGEYNIISGNFYRAKGFSQFQEDVVKVTYPSAMEKINSGGVEEFSFLSPRKNLLALGRKKISEKEKAIGHNPSTSLIVALTIACFSVECIQDTSTRFLTRSMQKKATSPGWLFFLFRSI